MRTVSSVVGLLVFVFFVENLFTLGTPLDKSKQRTGRQNDGNATCREMCSQTPSDWFDYWFFDYSEDDDCVVVCNITLATTTPAPVPPITVNPVVPTISPVDLNITGNAGYIILNNMRYNLSAIAVPS